MSILRPIMAEYAARAQALARHLTPLTDRLAQNFNRDRRFFWHRPNLSIARGPIGFGLWVFFLVFGLFGLWAILAPLDSAAVAHGVVVLNDNKKTIQHLEGGIVETIHVKEGDHVEAGAPLLDLSETAASARVDSITTQLHAEQASLARLIAERDGVSSITFPGELLSSTDSMIQETLTSQKNLFEARHQAMEGKRAVLHQSIAQSKEEITGLTAQKASGKKQLTLLQQEIEAIETLLKTGNATKPRLLALQRNSAELQGRIGEYQAMIARAQQTIAQTNVEILNLRHDHLKEVTDQIRDTQVTIANLAEQQRAAQDVLTRLTITAPQSGIITGLKAHTKGGVIHPGDVLMEIVPQDDHLIVEAQVLPQDIDVVHQGLEARVRLSAYKTRNLSPVKGQVTTLSADRFQNESTGQAYYLARISVDPAEFAHLKNVALYPGMPVEVLIVTGSRTMIGYLLSPLTDSLFHAFREQ